MPNDKLLTASEAAARLGVNYKFFQRNWADHIPHTKPDTPTGRGWKRFYESDIDRFKQSIRKDAIERAAGNAESR